MAVNFSESKLNLVIFDNEFVELSYKWLNDDNVKKLIDSNGVSKKQQEAFIKSLSNRKDYIIWGVVIDKVKVGACGLKNIENNTAEMFCYFGELDYTGKGWGGILLETLFRNASEIGVSLLNLKVFNKNERAIKAYIKSGFIETSIDDKYTYMIKSLKF
ncbi:GNAT family N-acetyltransferase [Vibrio splendidus]|uniref:GNAT family N-acetyltransferase n=1 Tax=Vibrio splendidus TaxID=29497 RepID=UPI000D36A1BB|nr:GNAT family protein [Vibrio splendidus]PTP92705.1 N-acetyltransferase [Vibrio splendidus]